MIYKDPMRQWNAIVWTEDATVSIPISEMREFIRTLDVAQIVEYVMERFPNCSNSFEVAEKTMEMFEEDDDGMLDKLCWAYDTVGETR